MRKKRKRPLDANPHTPWFASRFLSSRHRPKLRNTTQWESTKIAYTLDFNRGTLKEGKTNIIL